MGFKVYDLVGSDAPNSVENGTILEIIDKYAEGKDAPTIRCEMFLPLNVVKGVIKDMQEIELMITRIMTGNAIVVEEQKDEEGNIIQEKVYNTKPESIEELQGISLDLMVRDYTKKVKGNYNAEDALALKEQLEHCVNTIVRCSVSSKDADFDTFKTFFD